MDDVLAMQASLMTACKVKNDGLVICGDFNYPDIDWDLQSGPSLLDRIFIDFVQEQYLTQHVKEITRSREGQQDSLLDLILTDRPSLNCQQDYLHHYMAPIGKSDHCALSYDIEVTPPALTLKESFRYYRGKKLVNVIRC